MLRLWAWHVPVFTSIHLLSNVSNGCLMIGVIAISAKPTTLFGSPVFTSNPVPPAVACRRLNYPTQ